MVDAEVADSKVKEEEVSLSAAIAPVAARSTCLNNGQRESRTWSHPTLRFLIVWSCRETKAPTESGSQQWDNYGKAR